MQELLDELWYLDVPEETRLIRALERRTKPRDMLEKIIEEQRDDLALAKAKAKLLLDGTCAPNVIGDRIQKRLELLLQIR